MRQILDAYLSMNTQGALAKSGWLDHLCFWTLGDYDTIRMWDKTSRYKINEGTSALAQAMFNDCQDVNLLLSTPVVSIHRTDYKRVTIQTQSRQFLIAHAAIITVPLNASHNLEFQTAVEPEKQRSIMKGQCRSGTKFWMKLENSVGNWCSFAPYPNRITVAYTDDKEGTIIVGFVPDNTLDIGNIGAIEYEIQKFVKSNKFSDMIGVMIHSSKALGHGINQIEYH